MVKLISVGHPTGFQGEEEEDSA